MPSDKEIRQMIATSSFSDWLKEALLSALERDPIEAAADAGLLSIVLDYRANAKDAESQALQAILAAKLGED